MAWRNVQREGLAGRLRAVQHIAEGHRYSMLPHQRRHGTVVRPPRDDSGARIDGKTFAQRGTVIAKRQREFRAIRVGKFRPVIRGRNPDRIAGAGVDGPFGHGRKQGSFLDRNGQRLIGRKSAAIGHHDLEGHALARQQGRRRPGEGPRLRVDRRVLLPRIIAAVHCRRQHQTVDQRRLVRRSIRQDVGIGGLGRERQLDAGINGRGRGGQPRCHVRELRALIEFQHRDVDGLRCRRAVGHGCHDLERERLFAVRGGGLPGHFARRRIDRGPRWTSLKGVAHGTRVLRERRLAREGGVHLRDEKQFGQPGLRSRLTLKLSAVVKLPSAAVTVTVTQPADEAVDVNFNWSP